MNSSELNKVLGALLDTGTFLVATNIAADAIFASEIPVRPGYEIAAHEPSTAEAPVERAPEQEPIQERLARANVEQEEAARKCAACHTFENGGPNHNPPFGFMAVVTAPRNGSLFQAVSVIAFALPCASLVGLSPLLRTDLLGVQVSSHCF